VSKKSKVRTFLKGAVEQLRLDSPPEKTEPFQEPSGEELNMHVVELNYGDQSDLARQMLDYIGPRGDEIDRETGQVLRIEAAPDGTIIRLTPPPGRKLDLGVILGDELDAE